MNPLTLNEIKQIELQLLKRFDGFCRQHGIRYFLSNGTLLGAVKYNGFIPWDDDVDVLVPREDYDRLIAIFPDGDGARLVSYERDPEYLFPFAKLCDTSTVKEEGGLNNGIVLGVNMDVFPLDAWNDDLKKARREAKQIRRQMLFLGLTKRERADSKNRIKYMIKTVLMRHCKKKGGRHYIKRISDLCSRRAEKGARYLGCKAWCIYGEREIIPADVFEDTVEIGFEDERFPAPIGYDAYLRSLYGDYRKDPPVEKQKTHHNFTAYRL